jgi:hypothetical protein
MGEHRTHMPSTALSCRIEGSMSRAPGKFVVQHSSPGAALGTLDAFFVMRCFGSVSPEDIRASAKCGLITTGFRPEGAASIVVVDPTAAFPSEETRRTALDVSRETSSLGVGLAIVILGDGFWASAIRGVVTTLTSLSPTNTTPRKVVRYEEEAVDWAIETLGESPKYRPALLAALNQLKSTVTAPPPTSKSPPSTSKPPGALSKVPPSSKRRAG